MQIHVEEVSPCRKKFSIEIPAEDVSKEFGAVVSEYQRSAPIQGFRAGKAPPRLVRSRFARQIQETVRDRLLPRGYQEAVEKEGRRPVAVLEVQDGELKDGQAYSFQVVCDVPPVFDLPTYKGIEVPGQEVVVTEEMVDNVFNQLRESEATFTDVDRPIQDGDMVQLNYLGRCPSQPEKEPTLLELGMQKVEAGWMFVDENTYLPGFRDALVGHQAKERVEIIARFPEDFSPEALRGVEVVYDVEILAVREKHLAEVDAAFLEKFRVETPEALRQLLREDLDQRMKDQEKGRIRNAISRHLLEKTEIPIPESELRDETREAIYRMVREVTARGMSEQELKENKEQLFESANQSAATRLKMRYILGRIAEEEKIEVSEAELNQTIRAIALRERVDPEAMRAHLQKKNLTENIRQDLRAQKTLDFLVEHAAITG